MTDTRSNGFAAALLTMALAGCGVSAPSTDAPAATGTPAAMAGGPATAAVEPAPPPDRTSAIGDCATSLPSGERWISLDADGRTREALLHVPPSAPAQPGFPAVVAFHGYTAHAADFAPYSGLSDVADAAGFVVAYPQALGDPTEWHLAEVPSWNPALEASDHELARRLLDWLVASGCVDAGRIFLAGHSQGGGMTADLTCELADRLAGIALVSGEYPRFPCVPSRPIPVVAFHALDDDILPYAGGRVAGAPEDFPNVLPVDEVLARYAAHNRCDAAFDSAPVEGGTRLTWRGCAAPVVLYRLASGGHGWQAATSDLAWSFFSGLPSLE